jgi:hypothetical protein
VHTLVHGGVIRPVLSRVTDREIVYAGPISLPTETTRIEKNWVLFDHGGELHCLYRLDPLTIFARGRDGAWRLVKRVDNGWGRVVRRHAQQLGEPRAVRRGQPRLLAQHRRRSLRAGRDASRREPRHSRARPACCSTDTTRCGGYKPGVLYVSALVVHEGRVLAFYGEGDAHSGVASFRRGGARGGAASPVLSRHASR